MKEDITFMKTTMSTLLDATQKQKGKAITQVLEIANHYQAWLADELAKMVGALVAQKCLGTPLKTRTLSTTVCLVDFPTVLVGKKDHNMGPELHLPIKVRNLHWLSLHLVKLGKRWVLHGQWPLLYT